tara:strand:+ start:1002 stop:2843 length:1842 start_codon:yes stop_codon:yes gene_type:complete
MEIDLDAIARKAAANKAAGQLSPPVQVEVVSEPSPMDGFGRQIELTGRAVAEGGAGLLGIAYDPIAFLMNKATGTEVPPLTQSVRQALTDLGVAEPETVTERIVQAIGAAAVGGGGSAKLATGAAKLLEGTPKVVAAALGSGPTSQVVGGGGAGAGGQITKELGGGEVAQLAASLAGGIVGGRAGQTRFESTPTDLPADLAAAERAGIRVMTSDALPPNTFASKYLQRLGEMVPGIGTGPVRAAQQTERADAVRNVLRDFGAADAATASDDVMASLLAKRGSDLTKFTGMKSQVIDGLEGAGAMDVSRTVAAIDDEIVKLTALKSDEYAPVIARLSDWKNSLPDQPITNIEVLRKQIGQSFKAPELASVRSTGEKSLTGIYGALRADMGDFIKANGQPKDFDKWKIANKNLSSMAGELKNNTLKAALSKGDMTPEAVNRLLFSTKPSDVRTLYKNLDATGRKHARSAILHEALVKAGNNIDEVSPDRFKQQLIRRSKQIGVFFSGDDLKAVEGLARALKITERAGQAAVSPATGIQAAPPIVAAVLTDMLGGFGAGLTAGAGIGASARIYESAPVRNLLMKIPQTRVGSAEEFEIAKRLADVLRSEKTRPDKE